MTSESRHTTPWIVLAAVVAFMFGFLYVAPAGWALLDAVWRAIS
jgi:hypothetical protein